MAGPWIVRWSVAIATWMLVVTAPIPASPLEAEVREESFAMDLPASWAEQDLSDRIFLSDSPTEVRRHFRLESGVQGNAPVYLEYTASPTPEPAKTVAGLRDTVERYSAQLAAWPPERLRQSVQTKGLGCMAGFELVKPPGVVPSSGEPGRHLAFDYEYFCWNGGAPVRGWAWAAFSPDGRTHRIFLTADEDYWAQEANTMLAVIDSIRLPAEGVGTAAAATR